MYISRVINYAAAATARDVYARASISKYTERCIERQMRAAQKHYSTAEARVSISKSACVPHPKAASPPSPSRVSIAPVTIQRLIV